MPRDPSREDATPEALEQRAEDRQLAPFKSKREALDVLGLCRTPEARGEALERLGLTNTALWADPLCHL